MRVSTNSRSEPVCAGGQYGSYHESSTGEVACGGEYGSYHEGRTGKVCAGGQYGSYHESSTGEVACGGEYGSYHEGRTGEVCAGGQYASYHEGRIGEIACGGQYRSYHKSQTGQVCFGGLYRPTSFESLDAVASGDPGVGAAVKSSDQTVRLMIFGGSDHKTYLGCLTCSEYDADSVYNEYGTHGSAYSNESIWNQYGDYGSKYSSEGACNPYADDPPVIVDQNGKYYGRLSLNTYHSESGIGTKFYDWLRKKVCGH